MSAQFGAILVYLAFASAAYAWIASLVGGRRGNQPLVESARNAAIITWPLLTAASVILIALLVRGEFNTSFVWEVTDLSMPTYLKMTALWGGQPGSLLFWSWLMSTFTALAMTRNWEREHDLMPHAISAMMGTLTFFVALVAFWENPFARYWSTPTGDVVAALFAPSAFWTPLETSWSAFAQRLPGLLGVVLKGFTPLTAALGSTAAYPANGNGLNPLLRHPGMVFHPPMLYLGFVAFVVPYAFGMASLSRGEVSDSWIRSTRRWTLVGWLFLSLGLILGGWWAYDVLGWGGYWGWDPVENAALLPWLTATPFLHSVVIEEKRGMFRRWNLLLITVTYLLVVLGTFATRSGFVSSVHSFAQSAIGPLFFMFLSAALIVSVWLLVKRWDDLRSDRPLESFLSREVVFMVNNFLFLSIAVAVFVGSYWPVVTELLADGLRFGRFVLDIPGVEKSSLGPEYYNGVTVPMWVALILLMGIAPLTAWGTSSLKRMGRSSIVPASAGVAAVVVVAALRALQRADISIPALIAYLIVVFSAVVTLYEFYRGARARMQSHGESFLAALWNLFGRNRRRYGGYLIHLGVVVMAIGVIGSNAYQQQTQREMAAGETLALGGYEMTYQNLERFVATDGRTVYRAQAIVTRNGREVAQIKPRIDYFPQEEGVQPMSIPGAYTNMWGDDFYVLLVTWEPLSLSNATFKVYYNPLISWVWAGGFIFIAGTLVAAWPDFSEERRAASVPARRKRSTISSPAPAAGD